MSSGIMPSDDRFADTHPSDPETAASCTDTPAQQLPRRSLNGDDVASGGEAAATGDSVAANGHSLSSSSGSTAQEPAQTPELSDESRVWLQRLKSAGRERDAAVAELHALLLRAARFTLSMRIALVRDRRERLDDLAVEAANDALVAILARLADYRGESRFTTWAWKFAILQASVALRRRDWTSREIPTEGEAWTALADRVSTEGQVEQREFLASLRDGVETVLTPYQRKIFVALALNEVPVDVLAERLGTTRGALYRTLSDARRRLRSHLGSADLA